MRDRKYEVSIANTIAMASGTNSDFAGPVMNVTGANTMQMHRVDTMAGTAISDALSRIASTTGLPDARCR